MNKYKVYVYDGKIDMDYPVITAHSDINGLANFLNNHIKRYRVEILNVILLDRNNGYVADVDFLPSEIFEQEFITTYPERLIAYNEFVNGGV
jgi:hypothetical protein